MKIIFYNHFHNGDVYHAKEFVRNVAQQLDQEVEFQHNCNPRVLLDLEQARVKQGSLHPILHDKHRVHGAMLNDDTLAINTHIGVYFGMGLEHTDECTLRFNMSMWKLIYDYISKKTGKELILHGPRHYIPFIDFTKYSVINAHNFLARKTKKVLICNGPANSGQCAYNGDMLEITRGLAIKYPNIDFILTQDTPLRISNVCYTNQINGDLKCDLNEIGYLAVGCDLIIGRNSGPYCFSVNQFTAFDGTKKFFAFGERETDCFLHGIETPAKFTFHKYVDSDSLYYAIQEQVETL